MLLSFTTPFYSAIVSNNAPSYPIAGIKFASDTRLSEEEMAPLNKLITLFGDHISLTNDLYSFDKEYRDHCSKGAILLNAVDVLHQLLGCGDLQTAKRVTRQLTWHVESELHEEYKRLLAIRDSFNSRRWRFIEGIFECLTG